jgi:hypothetical protein
MPCRCDEVSTAPGTCNFCIGVYQMTPVSLRELPDPRAPIILGGILPLNWGQTADPRTVIRVPDGPILVGEFERGLVGLPALSLF